MATPSNRDNVMMADCHIFYCNFSGNNGLYADGKRDFAVELSPEQAVEFANFGYNVKQTKVREEGDVPTNFLKVKINFGGRPPRIVLITSRGRTNLSEAEAELLDWVDIAMVDLVFSPYSWNVNGNSGISAYLQAIYVTIVEDEFEKKYAELPELRQGNQPLALPTNEPLQIEASDVENDIVEAELVED